MGDLAAPVSYGLSGIVLGAYRFSALSPEQIPLARALHHEEFLRAGYIAGPSPTGYIEDEFVASSTYFGAFEARSGELVGVVRQIPVGALLLPTLKNFDIEPSARELLCSMSGAQLVEIGSLAMRESHHVAFGLYAAMLERSYTLGHSCWVASLDRRLLRSLTIRGVPWHVIGESRLYMGSLTTPVMLKVEETRDIYARILEGVWT